MPAAIMPCGVSQGLYPPPTLAFSLRSIAHPVRAFDPDQPIVAVRANSTSDFCRRKSSGFNERLLIEGLLRCDP
jgi:hypothetical protein